jgi:hypothetical protein
MGSKEWEWVKYAYLGLFVVHWIIIPWGNLLEEFLHT